MSDEQPSDVLGALPRTRPHRRSEKRGSRGADATAPERTNGAPPESAPPEDAPPESASPEDAPPENAADTPAQTALSGGPEQPAVTAKAPSTRARKPVAKKTTAPKQRSESPGAGPRPTRASEPAPRAKRRSVRASEPAPQAKPRLRQPPQPDGTPNRAPNAKPAPARGTDLLGTAVQAAAELAEIGLSLSARAVRRAVSKLPRP